MCVGLFMLPLRRKLEVEPAAQGSTAATRLAELYVSVATCAAPFHRTTLVEFWPMYTVVNRTPMKLFVRQARPLCATLAIACSVL